jgi:murein L,D-transpeptidase YcbB/YkuD
MWFCFFSFFLAPGLNAQDNFHFIKFDFPRSTSKLMYPALVEDVYQIRLGKLLWFAPGDQSASLRRSLKDKIDSSTFIGLRKIKYHVEEINENVATVFSLQDSLAGARMDRIFTDAAIAYCKDLYEGAGIDKWMLYDELSGKSEKADNNYLVTNIAGILNANDLLNFLYSLEPKDQEYELLKNKLLSALDSLSSSRKRQIAISLNFYRWMHHFHFEKWIVVNIPSATLKYYEHNNLVLQMKVVVGKPSTRTLRFAANCNQVILYPYWNVPRSIAIKELLPKIKRNPGYIDDLNMQLIDESGNIVNYHEFNWGKYNSNYFPFRLRQSTGCDNSLGVIKFNLTSPFSVYLHDTNYKGAFLSDRRFISHGCIRLEKPIELANYLLNNKIDSAFLIACMKNQEPVPINLDKLVPVFVTYQTAVANDKGGVTFCRDVYGLLK